MNVRFSKRFQKEWRRLPVHDQKRVEHAVVLLREDPFNSTLVNHKLKGKKRGIRSISAGHDLRILYREEGDHVIVFLLRVGTHNQVY